MATFQKRLADALGDAAMDLTLDDHRIDYAAEIETPVLFMTGEENYVFTDSNIVCYERLQKITPGRHELHVYPNYGHQDPFMGKNVHVDIFPRLLEFLNKHSGG